ncbi:potassium channel family protein [Vallitalea guaymasensis]|uniref:Trk system potassium uptake protein TrkA n=1 Tax=Vallitalea guaymasensis TaxID=1185412 RepID=A0A8J8M8G9_9FIRM|nr:NAD-binding protein [Vallitalea guaymasensis]QUH28153.1 NAD-binding protein [Vallitalea guaymasensis]
MKNKVLLIGGFHKATALANSLINRGYSVTIINENYADCMSLAENNQLKVIHGDGSKPYVLDDAEAYENEIAIALTQHDEDNLVICQLCKKKFGIKKTVSLVNDPKKTDFFHKMGIDSVVCAINTITGIIEQQAFMDEMATVLPIGQGNISIAEVPILQSAPSVGKKIWEIDLPKEVIIGCILRGESSMVPRGDTRLLSGDILVLISSKENHISAIRELTGR